MGGDGGEPQGTNPGSIRIAVTRYQRFLALVEPRTTQTMRRNMRRRQARGVFVPSRVGVCLCTNVCREPTSTSTQACVRPVQEVLRFCVLTGSAGGSRHKRRRDQGSGATHPVTALRPSLPRVIKPYGFKSRHGRDHSPTARWELHCKAPKPSDATTPSDQEVCCRASRRTRRCTGGLANICERLASANSIVWTHVDDDPVWMVQSQTGSGSESSTKRSVQQSGGAE